MLSLDLQSRIPIFEQIKAGLSRLIYLGILKSDEQLPTVRSLATQLGVNPNTVQKAYQQLEAAGLVYSVTGRGNFVRSGNSQQVVQNEQIQKRLKEIAQEAKNAGFPESMAILLIREVYNG